MSRETRYPTSPETPAARRRQACMRPPAGVLAADLLYVPHGLEGALVLSDGGRALAELTIKTVRPAAPRETFAAQ